MDWTPMNLFILGKIRLRYNFQSYLHRRVQRYLLLFFLNVALLLLLLLFSVEGRKTASDSISGGMPVLLYLSPLPDCAPSESLRLSSPL